MTTKPKPPSKPQVKFPVEEFVCNCDELFRSACRNLQFYKEHEGKRYCVLHYPSKEKNAGFADAIQNKLVAEDFNFSGVWFPALINFAGINFNTKADFNSAVFGAVADFSNATFKAGADFRYAKLDEIFLGSCQFESYANFGDAEFKGMATFTSAKFDDRADFGSAKFKYVSFAEAKFSGEAIFTKAVFNGHSEFSSTEFGQSVNFRHSTFVASADFSSSKFSSYARFEGGVGNEIFSENASLNLMDARIEKPERIAFHVLRLRPHWFVNVDARKFEFVNVKWDDESVREEIEALREKRIEHPHRLLAIAYRQLAVNAEENHHYATASKFRYDSMESRLLEKWRGWAFWRLHWWYWLASGYGERIVQAFMVLLLILFSFACLYTQIGFTQSSEKTPTAAVTNLPDTTGKPLSFRQALVHSFEVALLQKPEPKPLTLTARFLVGLETLLGPLQGALLALAVRRKFMR